MIVGHVARTLSCEVELYSEDRTSGPMHGDDDPFESGDADLGFLCSPSYLYLREKAAPSVELVPAGFVFRDRRHRGEPVYFSDVVVRKGHPAKAFADLTGGVWGFNDECSLSGYFAMLQKLDEIGGADDFFERHHRTGSHRASVFAILEGTIDAASIDSTVLASLDQDCPEIVRQLRVLESWGPFPIQPVVVRSALGRETAERVARALLELPQACESKERLSSYGLERCVPIDESAYAEERRALCNLGHIPNCLTDRP